MTLNQYAKAIVAGLVPGILMFFTLRSGGVTADEWQVIIATVLAASGLTWAVPNTTKPTVPHTVPPTPDTWTSPEQTAKPIALHIESGGMSDPVLEALRDEVKRRSGNGGNDDPRVVA